MRLELREEARLDQPLQHVWRLLRDVGQLSALLPGVTNLKTVAEDREYVAALADRVGPFKLELELRVEVEQIEEPRLLKARVTGVDGKGQNRIKGVLTAELISEGGGTRLDLAGDFEILGRLVSLGATPIRRRANERFSEFVQHIKTKLVEVRGTG
ncbi:MAG: SRPBCC family protein [Acidobacteria bacterium]|nr:SRPBCC family protein [Acidobacteriota bacterium]